MSQDFQKTVQELFNEIDDIVSAAGSIFGLPGQGKAREAILKYLAAALAQVEGERDKPFEGCRCQSCGSLYFEDVMLTDALWNKVRPEGKPEGAGLLCGKCIGEKIEAALAAAENSARELRERLVSERAKNIRLQIRAEECGRPAHNFPDNQPHVDVSVNEEVLARRQIEAELDARKAAKAQP